MKKKLLFILFSLFFHTIYSQVGINTETPSSLTELEITNKVDSNNDRVPKGIMIPRMTETQRDKIDITTDASAANSLLIYNTTEDCYNYYSYTEASWRSLCGDFGKAVFTFDCSAITVLGTYTQDEAVTTSNYLKIAVTVTKAGNYSIEATTTNGYYFTASGTFATTGTFTVYAYATGTPENIGDNTLAFIKNGETVTCDSDVVISVVDPVATYNLYCSSITVNGTYAKGDALNSSTNTITMSVVNVTKIGSYTISTEETNGITFSASGTFTSTGSQTVTLVGSGTPTVNESFDVTITSNSPGGTTSCSATIEITLPALTYAIIGNSEYSWAGTARSLVFSQGYAFGTSGTVKIKGLTNLWTASTASTAVTNLNGTTQPDIILYFAQGASPSSTLMTALATYVNNGGVLMYATTDNDTTYTTTLLDGIFGSGVITSSTPGSSRNSYLIKNISDDPIINGPFGNIAGKYWGEDNSGTVMSYGIPSTCVQIASANNSNSNSSVSPDYSVIWYSTVKNFVYIGDSVYATYPSGSYYSTTDGTGAAVYTANGLPASKLNKYYTNYAYYMYNSYLELNALAWGLKKAATSGINSY